MSSIHNSQSYPKATVFILTKNGLPLLETCLRMVFKQKTLWPFEVLAVDSGSTDGTLDLLQKYPVKVVHTSPASFNHGTSRNLGIEHASGEFVVLLVQDAIPCDENWLANLVSACDLDNVAGSYSKQVVRPESSLITHYLSRDTTPTSNEREIKMLAPGQHLVVYSPAQQFRLALFQDGCSCIRKSIWLSHPFIHIPYGEDIEWGKRIISAGYALIYEPSSAVYHSHDRSAIYLLKRSYADHYLVTQLFSLVLIPNLFIFLKTLLWAFRDAWRYISAKEHAIATQVKFELSVIPYLAATIIGQYLGTHMYHWLPKYKWSIHLDRFLRQSV